MLNIIIGAVAILFGMWLMFGNWWATLDLVRTVFPILLVLYGIVALMAGLKRFGRKSPEKGQQ